MKNNVLKELLELTVVQKYQKRNHQKFRSRSIFFVSFMSSFASAVIFFIFAGLSSSPLEMSYSTSLSDSLKRSSLSEEISLFFSSAFLAALLFGALPAVLC